MRKDGNRNSKMDLRMNLSINFVIKNFFFETNLFCYKLRYNLTTLSSDSNEEIASYRENSKSEKRLLLTEEKIKYEMSEKYIKPPTLKTISILNSIEDMNKNTKVNI